MLTFVTPDGPWKLGAVRLEANAPSGIFADNHTPVGTKKELARENKPCTLASWRTGRLLCRYRP
jgi:hypothetical protein